MATLIEQDSEKEIKQEQNNHTDEEIEFDLMDILRKIIDIRKTIYKAASIGLLIGIVVAISIPKQYTVEVTLSPEMGSAKGGGLSGLAASFLGSGVATNDGSDALNASLSADIVSSTPFLLELSTMKTSVSEDENMTLDSYLDEESFPWWDYVIGLPSKVVDGIKSLFTEKKDESKALNRNNQGTIELSKKEFLKIEVLKRVITATVDKKTSMTSVTVTLQNPKIAAVVADSVVRKLQEYITDYRTSKAKEDCLYLEKLFKERQQEYYVAQKEYANYIDSHDNIILQSVRAEQERLQNDMSLAYQVYSQVANQLQLARAKVQEEKPVFAVVEPAVVPLNPSGINKKIYVLVFVFLSVCFVMFWKLLGEELLGKFKEIRVQDYQ
ncbi:Wzz/FepE/Etk N-terminal domain-containing protein [Bacteroides sp.]|uniref:Wzz/FepE/Etk N-terminal domain-containing protein n=1 Tax=Bacteroides sp. TaxID=29523 RepID=UPI002A840827|nr:Wzz/FepE/Etk N-terminal domain-containing protein [Bacteroides sp.]